VLAWPVGLAGIGMMRAEVKQAKSRRSGSSEWAASGATRAVEMDLGCVPGPSWLHMGKVKRERSGSAGELAQRGFGV
jgi:hypothetical protein